jgi:hypothetical protein
MIQMNALFMVAKEQNTSLAGKELRSHYVPAHRVELDDR